MAKIREYLSTTSSIAISCILAAELGFGWLALPANASLTTGIPTSFQEATESSQQVVASVAVGNQKRASTLVVEKSGAPQDNTLRFPLKFAAAPGETVGSIQAIVTIPNPKWKFKKIELPQGSRLKVSSKQKKRDDGSLIVEVSFSSGSRAIRDGIIATILFSIPKPSVSRQTTAETPQPDVWLISAMPPETDNVSESSPPPIAPPPPPEPNPSTGCFVFSH